MQENLEQNLAQNDTASQPDGAVQRLNSESFASDPYAKPATCSAFFRTSDGVELFYRYRLAQTDLAGKRSNLDANTKDSEPKAIIVFHRGHEHSGRVEFLFDELNLSGFSYFAWDQRGHGRSPGERGDAPSIGRLVADVDEFAAHVSHTYGIKPENIAVIAQSVGAVLVCAWLHDYAPRIRCAVLASPAFSVKLYVPFARAGLDLLHRARGNFYVQSYVKSHYLTHDFERTSSFDADSLITRAISVRILLGLYEAAHRVVSDAAAITTPVQLLISGSDWVVRHAPQHEFYATLGSHVKQRHILSGFYHDTLGEKDRAQALSLVSDFINERFSVPFEPVDQTSADKFGFTRTEADRLSAPPCKFKQLYFGSCRALMKLFSSFSQGLKIGEMTGYDSGSTLDYVYQNTPQGSNKFGKFIDRCYLNAIGWRGIRTRKANLKIALNYALSKLKASGKEARVLDIASGHGRYILDALDEQNMPSKIYLRDYSQINVAAGRRLIKERGLEQIASFEQVDAFSAASYDSLEGSVNLGVVSGLFELFSDNSLITTALEGFARDITSGGYLIYTNQPFHPQLEFIARVLSSHRAGAAWVMRRRTQVEMDQLVSKAGFTKIREYIDDDGIFSVSVAVRD